ncbi:hypothetical protein [Flavobacterium sp. J27]|uniref:hypothetical protein n=1 Tax=Flavobacterium sp. J27 TaxID=2060419 RepID=UPI0010324ECB|nr:hypothetical protein [Flavobacterium sp. J27]
MKYTEEVINISVSTGTNGDTVTETTTPDGTQIVGVAIFHSGLTANTDIINAMVSVDGVDVSKMQHIENYRSREAGYNSSYKPLVPFQSGRKVKFEVRSETNFTSDFKAQLILIKEPNNC